MTLKRPLVYEYHSPITYISETLNWLKKNKRYHSIRYFAKKSGWPVSYANDLLALRKRLTIQRTIQFAIYMQLCPHEADYFVILSMREHEDPLVKEFVSAMLARFTEATTLAPSVPKQPILPRNLEES